MSWIILVSGAVVGLSLGLTGGGGALLAVPLLTYGAGLSAREAVGLSLASVGTTSLIGGWQRARRGLVEFPTGLLFATAGDDVDPGSRPNPWRVQELLEVLDAVRAFTYLPPWQSPFEAGDGVIDVDRAPGRTPPRMATRVTPFVAPVTSDSATRRRAASP